MYLNFFSRKIINKFKHFPQNTTLMINLYLCAYEIKCKRLLQSRFHILIPFIKVLFFVVVSLQERRNKFKSYGSRMGRLNHEFMRNKNNTR